MKTFVFVPFMTPFSQVIPRDRGEMHKVVLLWNEDDGAAGHGPSAAADYPGGLGEVSEYYPHPTGTRPL